MNISQISLIFKNFLNTISIKKFFLLYLLLPWIIGDILIILWASMGAHNTSNLSIQILIYGFIPLFFIALSFSNACLAFKCIKYKPLLWKQKIKKIVGIIIFFIFGLICLLGSFSFVFVGLMQQQ
jgi:drug/metabolite transporter (DMT)-like permease